MQQKSLVIGLLLGTIDLSTAVHHSKHKKYDAFSVPRDIMESDWTGTKYVTSHRCFGHRCKEDEESAVQLSQPLGLFELQRDSEAGYPAYKSSKDTHDFAKDHIDSRTGRFKTPFEVSEEKAAEAQKDLEETYEKPYFKLKEGFIDDWPGTRYVTTHRCFGHPCKSDLKKEGLLVQLDEPKMLPKQGASLMQTQDDYFKGNNPQNFEIKEGSFKIGDLQSNRYGDWRTWRPQEDDWPQADKSNLEDVTKFVLDRYVPEQGRILTTEEIDDKADQDFRKMKMDNKNMPAFIDKEHVSDDWATHHSKEGVFCYGKHSCQFDQSFVQLGESADPYDPNYKDVDDIMKRFADEDKEKAQLQEDMTVGDDPRGGIDKIAIASLKHNKDEDTKFIKTTVETFTTGNKGPSGLPNGERILERAQAQLAAEEIIHTWVSAPGISEPAMELFMKQNLGTVWKQYDSNNRGYLDSTEWTYFMRNLLESMAPESKEEKNPYAEEDSDSKKSKKASKPKKITKKDSESETKTEETEDGEQLEKKSDKKDKKVSDEEAPKKEKKETTEEEEAPKKKNKTATSKEEVPEEKAETTTEESANKKKKTTEKAPEGEDK